MHITHIAPSRHTLSQVLGELVEASGYSPQAAAELHKQLYRQKVAPM
jgi:hypothetical protein